MLIKRIAGATRNLGAPSDWNGQDMSCGVLPVLDMATTEGNFMVSAWEPTPAEIAAINAGHSIHLGIRGSAHPVVFVAVQGSEAFSNAEQPENLNNVAEEDRRQFGLTPSATRNAALEEGRQQGIVEAERWVMARRDAFIEQHGSTDPATGALEFGRGVRGDLKREYVAELDEIADGIISLSDAPLQSSPAPKQDDGEAKVRRLLWDDFPICCGNFQPGEWHMGMNQPDQCCGSPDRDMLDDAAIVASLRELFPEPESKEGA